MSNDRLREAAEAVVSYGKHHSRCDCDECVAMTDLSRVLDETENARVKLPDSLKRLPESLRRLRDDFNNRARGVSWEHYSIAATDLENAAALLENYPSERIAELESIVALADRMLASRSSTASEVQQSIEDYRVARYNYQRKRAGDI